MRFDDLGNVDVRGIFSCRCGLRRDEDIVGAGSDRTRLGVEVGGGESEIAGMRLAR